MKTPYEQIVDTSMIGRRSDPTLNNIFALAEQESFSPSVNDSKRRLLLIIDAQKDFMDGGSLGVPGATEDVERITRFIYNNMGGITRIMCSLDTHKPHQIFHPCWWADSEGNHPKPYTVITYDDVKNNLWRPLIAVQDSINYLKELEKVGKQLVIWPYHCISGTDGATLENELAKMVFFHSVARSAVAQMIQKGTDPLSEMYGIIKPEYSKTNFINTPILTAIEQYDEIYIVGEAASHCVLESVRQIVEYFANRPEVTRKITILEDCTSAIPGYEDATTVAFANFRNSYGVKFAKSTDIVF